MKVWIDCNHITETSTTSPVATTTDAATQPATTAAESGKNNDGTLPQTGYPLPYKTVAGLAALITAAGAVMVIRNRKEDE